MKRLILATVALFSVPVFAQTPRSLGVWGLWGAFEQQGRCWAVSQPVQAQRGPASQPFLAVGHWPARRARGQVHVRLSREKRPGSAVLLRIDGRSFQLRGGGSDAWAPDARADAEIVAAMRSGLNLIVATRSTSGQLVRDGYALRGAATAIDAAAIACRPRS